MIIKISNINFGKWIWNRKRKKELEDLFSKEKGEKVYIDWDLYEGNFSEAMHYSLYER